MSEQEKELREKKICIAKRAFEVLFPLMAECATFEDIYGKNIFKIRVNTDHPFLVYFAYTANRKWALLSDDLVKVIEEESEEVC